MPFQMIPTYLKYLTEWFAYNHQSSARAAGLGLGQNCYLITKTGAW